MSVEYSPVKKRGASQELCLYTRVLGGRVAFIMNLIHPEFVLATLR